MLTQWIIPQVSTCGHHNYTFQMFFYTFDNCLPKAIKVRSMLGYKLQANVSNGTKLGY